MSKTSPNLLGDFRLLVYAFIALRLILLMVYQPQLIETNDSAQLERGLTVLGDFREHNDFAQRISADNLPYRDYWVEFPPVWIGLAALGALLTDDFTAWASLLYLVMLAFDVGNLILIHLLDKHLHGGIGLAWIYAIFAAPLVMLAWNFEAIVLFSMLAGFYFYIRQTKDLSPLLNNRSLHFSAGVVGFGVLTKYIPALLLPTIWRFSDWQAALRYTMIITVLVLVSLIPLVIWGGDMAVTSLTVQFSKPSYQTIWALIDSNYGTGSFPGGEIRYDSDIPKTGNHPVIPGWLRMIPFAAVGLWIFRLPMQHHEANILAFFTVTVTLFMLWAQGWSPQWAVILTPLILLNFPSRAGVLACLALMLGAFIEYPLLFRYSADTANLISGTYRLPFALLILMRTLLLAGISAVLVQKLRTI